VAGDDAWCGSGVFADRYEKSATALVALARTLRRSPWVAGAAGFIELYDRVADLPAEAFTRVWSADPGAYLWVHRAFDLTATCVGGATPTHAVSAYVRALGVETACDALARHLDEFKGLVLAAHLAAGRDCRLTQPWTVGLPWAIPGTAHSGRRRGARPRLWDRRWRARDRDRRPSSDACARRRFDRRGRRSCCADRQLSGRPLRRMRDPLAAAGVPSSRPRGCRGDSRERHRVPGGASPRRRGGARAGRAVSSGDLRRHARVPSTSSR